MRIFILGRKISILIKKSIVFVKMVPVSHTTNVFQVSPQKMAISCYAQAYKNG